MYVGKILFAQVMEFVPWTSFTRIVCRYRGNAGVRTLSCAEQFRAMAFAQLTWRESLRDIEVSLSANVSKLYAMGFRSAVKRATLADANESRDWRIWFDLATSLIHRARKLYASESLGVDLDDTVYALDSSTIDLCLSLFDWAPFRSTKAAIKLQQGVWPAQVLKVNYACGFIGERLMKFGNRCWEATLVRLPNLAADSHIGNEPDRQGCNDTGV